MPDTSQWVPVTLSELKPGDHVRRKGMSGNWYYHHAIFISPEEVIAALGKETQAWNPLKRGGGIEKTSWAEFAQGKPVEKRVYTDREKPWVNSPQKTCDLARAFLGIRNYDFVSQNCEAFANLCTFGKAESEQVNKAIGSVAGAVLGTAALAELSQYIKNGWIRIPLKIAGILGGAIAGQYAGEMYTKGQFYVRDEISDEISNKINDTKNKLFS